VDDLEGLEPRHLGEATVGERRAHASPPSFGLSLSCPRTGSARSTPSAALGGAGSLFSVLERPGWDESEAGSAFKSHLRHQPSSLPMTVFPAGRGAPSPEGPRLLLFGSGFARLARVAWRRRRRWVNFGAAPCC
jgi:hypothetical protein